MKALTLMVGVKNEAPYIPEWIEFHLLQGVDHFLVYDNGSTDNLAETLEPYTADGKVTLISIPLEFQNNGAGIWAIRHAIGWGVDWTHWLMCSGVDEYLFCPQGERLPQFLREFDLHAGIAVSWKMFNSSGRERKADGLVIERFTDTYREGTPHVKSIIQPRKIQAIANPHYFIPHEPWSIVNENHEEVLGAHPPYVSFRRIRINHYWTMSREEFEIKMRKGRSDQPGQDFVRREGADDLWNHAHHPNEQTGPDMSLQVYADAVKEALRKRKEKAHAHQEGNQ